MMSAPFLPNSKVPLRVGHRNDGDASLSLNKKHPIGEALGKGTPNNAFVDNRIKMRIPFV
jgi:hypothetical protein